MNKVPSPSQIQKIKKDLDGLYEAMSNSLIDKPNGIMDYGWPPELENEIVWKEFKKEMLSCGWVVTKEYVRDLWNEKDPTATCPTLQVLPRESTGSSR